MFEKDILLHLRILHLDVLGIKTNTALYILNHKTG